MSLRQLADRLGLSQTTVSRALNGYPEVSAATRARVAEEARRMNYAPDARARSLATGRSMAVGHVLPEASQHELVNPVFADFIAGAGRVYAEEGYDMMLTLVADGDEDAAYRRLRARGRVDGIILQVPRPKDPRIDLLREIGMPFIVHGRAEQADRDYSWLDMDNFAAFSQLTTHLTALGHRRIALLNGPERANFAVMRRAGFLAALDAAGIDATQAWLRHNHMTEQFGHETAYALLDATERPTAFVTSSMLIATGVRRAVEEHGLTMGRDISVVTHDDDLSYLPNGMADAPVFTATRVSVREGGQLAARMLLRLIAEPQEQPLHRLQETKFLIGPSSGPVPA